MKVRSFELNGFLVEIHSEKIPSQMVRLTIYLNGKKIRDSDMEIPEAELEETAAEIEQSFRNNLSV